MIRMSLAEIATVVGGRLNWATGEEMVTGTVEFDSREVGPGGLFVAVPGERVDGHDFATSAVAAGAVAVLAARPVGAPAVLVPPASHAHTRSVALTGDVDGSGAAVLAGLGELARAVAERLSGQGLTVVSVTGSSGKTSTKDLLTQVLEPMGPTVAPPGSFNNELGHPWTVLRADEATRLLILELSARGPGHIAALCATAPPRIGVVLNVGTAHLGEFGSQAEIARTKGELVEALPADGLAVLNADDKLVAAMVTRTRARAVLVGRGENADVRAVDVAVDEEARARFRLVCAAGEIMVRLRLHGEHHVNNALAVAAVAMELGAGLDDVAGRLSAAGQLSGRRMEVITRADGVTVVNDAYNANPDSMAAALRSLSAMASSGRRTWAVLGMMSELGKASDTAHEQIGRLVAELCIERLVVVGEQARAILAGVDGQTKRAATCAPDVDAVVALLKAEARPGDIILIKASKSFAFWRIAEELVAREDRR